MKCWKCGNELTTGDAPNSAQCRRCEQASISSSPASAGSAPVRITQDTYSLYMELIMAVARCFPGESRHATALRYIQEAERRAGGCGCAAQNAEREVRT